MRVKKFVESKLYEISSYDHLSKVEFSKLPVNLQQYIIESAEAEGLTRKEVIDQWNKFELNINTTIIQDAELEGVFDENFNAVEECSLKEENTYINPDNVKKALDHLDELSNGLSEVVKTPLILKVDYESRGHINLESQDLTGLVPEFLQELFKRINISGFIKESYDESHPLMMWGVFGYDYDHQGGGSNGHSCAHAWWDGNSWLVKGMNK